MDDLVESFAALVRIKRKRVAGKYDVFLCHNSEDKPEIRTIAQRLKELGYLPWFDEWELQPGKSWQKGLEEAIGGIQAAAVFVGRSGLGPWQETETEAALQLFLRDGRPAIPVVLPSCPEEPELPLFLATRTWVDFRLLQPDPMKRLIWGITGRA